MNLPNFLNANGRELISSGGLAVELLVEESENRLEDEGGGVEEGVARFGVGGKVTSGDGFGEDLRVGGAEEELVVVLEVGVIVCIGDGEVFLVDDAG